MKSDIDWGSSPPQSVTLGFIQATFGLRVELGYMVFPGEGMKLMAFEHLGHGPPTVWKQFWVSREAALKQALDLVADAEQYLDVVSTKRRPAEALDYDDFIEHLRLYLAGGMH